MSTKSTQYFLSRPVGEQRVIDFFRTRGAVLESIDRPDAEAAVFLTLEEGGSQFPVQLFLVWADDAVSFDDVSTARALASQFDCDVAMDPAGDEADPFRWRVMTRDGRVLPADEDLAESDEQTGLVLKPWADS